MTDANESNKPKRPNVKTLVSVYVDSRPDLALMAISHLQKGTNEKGVRFFVSCDSCDSFTTDVLQKACEDAGDRWSVRCVTTNSRIEAHRQAGQFALESGIEELCLIDGDVLVPDGWLSELRKARASDGVEIVFPLSNKMLSGSIALTERRRLPHALKGVSWPDAAALFRSKYKDRDVMPSAYLCDVACALTSSDFFMSATPPDEGLSTGVYLEEYLENADTSAVVKESVYCFHFAESVADLTSVCKMEIHDLYLRSPSSQMKTKTRQKEWAAKSSEYSHYKVSNRDKAGISFTSQYLDGFGAFSSIIDLANMLTLRGVNAELVYVNNDHTSQELVTRGVKFKNRRGLIGRSDKACIGKGLNVATHWTSGSLVVGACENNASLLPVAYWQAREDTIYRFGGMKLVSPQDELAYKSITQKVCASEHLKQSAENDLQAAGFRKIHPGVNTNLFYPPDSRGKSGQLRVLCLNRAFITHKGADLNEDLFTQIKAEHGPSVSLEIFGEDARGDFIDRSHKRISRAELAVLLRSVDVVVSLSKSEGVCSLGLEAMASGAAFVCVNNGAVEEYGTPENCIIATPETVKDAVSMLLAQSEQRERLGIAGRETALQFTIEKQCEAWENYITLVMNPPQKTKTKKPPAKPEDPPKDAEPLQD